MHILLGLTKTDIMTRHLLLPSYRQNFRRKVISRIRGEVLHFTIHIAFSDCGYTCNSNFSRDYYTVAKERCDIFHRCHDNNVYSTFCPPETFFNPAACTCDHSKKIGWCRSDGLNYGIEGKDETWCDESKTTKGTTTNETLSQTTKGGTEQTTSATTKQTNKATTENRTDADTEKTTNATTKQTTDADTKQTADADTKQTTDEKSD